MTLECGDYQKLIPGFLLGGLAAEQEKALEQHLGSCPHCRSEQERYAQTLRMLESVDDEAVPRHFFVYAEGERSNPAQLFRRMTPLWQAATGAVAAVLFAVSLAAVLQLQIRSERIGWVIGFGGSGTNAASFKEDILSAAEKRNRDANLAWGREVEAEIERSRNKLAQQQQAELAAALARLDSRLTNRMTQTAGYLSADTRKLVVDVCQRLAQQRAQDLNLIRARFESADENDTLKARQTDAILDTLLQVAELKLREGGDQK
jgi:hypothetical protein